MRRWINSDRRQGRAPKGWARCGCRCSCNHRTDLAVKVYRRGKGVGNWLRWMTRTTQICDSCISPVLEYLPARDMEA